MSFLVEDLEKPPFFSLLLIPTGSSPSSSLRLSSNIYNPKSKALVSFWKASRERDLLFSPHQSRRRCSATESGQRKGRAAPGAPARSRRCPSLRRARLTKLRAQDAGLSPEGEESTGPGLAPRLARSPPEAPAARPARAPRSPCGASPAAEAPASSAWLRPLPSGGGSAAPGRSPRAGPGSARRLHVRGGRRGVG